MKQSDELLYNHVFELLVNEARSVIMTTFYEPYEVNPVPFRFSNKEHLRAFYISLPVEYFNNGYDYLYIYYEKDSGGIFEKLDYQSETLKHHQLNEPGLRSFGRSILGRN